MKKTNVFITSIVFMLLISASLFADYTGDLTGSGTASASSVDYSPDYDADKAFNNNLDDGWRSKYFEAWPQWLMYDFGAGNEKKIEKYVLRRASTSSSHPVSWEFQGSNDGAAWTTLHSQSNNFADSWYAEREFEFQNANYYRFYRILISASDTYYAQINEFDMMEKIVDMGVKQGADAIDNGGDYDFGAHLKDATTEVSFTIENNGNENPILSGSPFVAISGANADQFSVVQQPTSPISPSSSTSFSVKFAPTAIGSFSAQLSISNNDGDKDPYIINLSGTGVYPDIVIYEDDELVIADGDMTPDEDDGTDFGWEHVPDGEYTVTFYIENRGNADLVLSPPGVTLSGSSDFSVDSQPDNLTIAPEEREVFDIRFKPTVADTANATVSIAHNADDSPYTFAVRGIGGKEEIKVTAAQPLQNGDMQPSSTKGTDFGGVYVIDARDTLSFTIENTGNWPLDIFSLGSGNDQIFSLLLDESSPLSNGESDWLDTNESFTFKIIFDPEESITYTSLISIVSSDADDTPFTFLVKGNGAQLGAVRATVWNDANANGRMDDGEGGFQDVTVILEQDENQAAYSKRVTNNAGQVKFNQLNNGEYTVTVDETMLPEGGVSTTGGASQKVVISQNALLHHIKFGYHYTDSTIVDDYNEKVDLPWNLPLAFVQGSPSFVKEPWSNAVDGVVYGWSGTATVKGDDNGDVWAVFQVDGGPCQFNRMTIIVDNGPDDNGLERRQITQMQILTSIAGSDSADFTPVAVFDLKKETTVYHFDATLAAAYIKVVALAPAYSPQTWRQVVEIALGDPGFELDKSTFETETEALPTVYSLGQNYPNPFNPATTISYTLPEAQNVNIAVYNIKGDLVKQLVSGRQEAGVYSISWDATNAAGQKVTTGVYLYRIKAGEFNETKKMTLMQ